jgi:hypothetical protein
MVGLENQNEYNSYLFPHDCGVFSGAKPENGGLTGIIIKCRYNIYFIE